MKEIRIHARAGQGAITTGVLLATSAFVEGKYAQAFPHFGAERMGAPLNAFVRIDDQPIRVRCHVKYPNHVLVVDPTLITGHNVLEGLQEDGAIVINTEKTLDELDLQTSAKVLCVPASDFAEKHIGRRQYGNTAVLGGFIAGTKELQWQSLEIAIKKRFRRKDIAQKNLAAAKEAFEYVLKEVL